MLEIAYRNIAQRYDSTYGGFDSTPKFPQAMALDFLLRHGARTDNHHATDIIPESVFGFQVNFRNQMIVRVQCRRTSRNDCAVMEDYIG